MTEYIISPFLPLVCCILVTYGSHRKNKVTTTLERHQSSMSRIHTLERTLHARILAAIPGVTKIGPVIKGHVVLTMGTHGLGIAVPSKRDLLTTSLVLISREKNRFLDEVRTQNVSYIVPSAELLSERSCSKDTEPCDITDTRSRELEGNPSRVRRLASNPVTLTARPVCFTKGTIFALERKWRILPACPAFAGRTFSTAISKMVTQLLLSGQIRVFVKILKISLAYPRTHWWNNNCSRIDGTRRAALQLERISLPQRMFF